MNFFQQIFDLNLSGNLQISITKTADQSLTLAVFLADNAGSTANANQIRPMVMSGTPAQLDEAFLATISLPMQRTSEFFQNTDTYLKALEKTKSESAMAKANPKSEADKKYDAQMKRSEELEAEGKFREAWMKVPDISEYPGKEAILRERREKLSEKFSPDLFSKSKS